jgi:hypothetical protein
MLHVSDVEGYIASCVLERSSRSCVSLCALLFDLDTQATRSSQPQPTTVRGLVITSTQAARAFTYIAYFAGLTCFSRSILIDLKETYTNPLYIKMSTTHLTIYDLLRITYTYENKALRDAERMRRDSVCSVSFLDRDTMQGRNTDSVQTPESCLKLAPPSPGGNFSGLETDFTQRYSRKNSQ